jgi:hypothetical protein
MMLLTLTGCLFADVNRVYLIFKMLYLQKSFLKRRAQRCAHNFLGVLAQRVVLYFLRGGFVK